MRWRYECQLCGSVVRAETRIGIDEKARGHNERCAKEHAKQLRAEEIAARQGRLF